MQRRKPGRFASLMVEELEDRSTPSVGVPVVNAGPDQTVFEGSQPNSFSLIGTFQDPTPALFGDTAVFRVYDSSGLYVNSGDVFVNQVTHKLYYSVTRLRPGIYTINLLVTNDQLTGSADTHLTVLPSPGFATPYVNGGSSTHVVPEGTQPNSFTFTASYEDSTPAIDGDTGMFYVYAYETSGPALNQGAVQLDPKTGTLTYTVGNLAPGTYKIDLTVSNGHNTGAGVSYLIITANPPTPATPVVNAGPDHTYFEGVEPNVFQLTGSFTDDTPAANGDSANFSVYDSTGRFVEAGNVLVNQQTKSLSYTVTHLTPGNYTVNLAVSNGQKTGTGVTHLTIVPNPAARPVVFVASDVTVKEGVQPNSFTLSGTFSDATPGRNGDTATFSVFDAAGQLVEAGVAKVNQSARTFSCLVTKLVPGSYTVQFSVSNDQLTGTGVTHLLVLPNAAVPVVKPGSYVSYVDTTVPQPTWIGLAGSFSDATPSSAGDRGTFTVYDATGRFVKSGAIQINQGQGTFTYAVQLKLGSYTIYVAISNDQKTGKGVAKLTVLARPIAVAAPSVNAGPGRSVNAGAAVLMTGAFKDSGSGPWVGDYFIYDRTGKMVQAGSVHVNQTTRTFSYNVSGLKPGEYTVLIWVMNGRATGSGTTQLRVLPLPRVATSALDAVFAQYNPTTQSSILWL